MDTNNKDFGFIKALILSSLFFTLTPIAIISSLASLFFLSYPKTTDSPLLTKLRSTSSIATQLYQSEEYVGQVLGVNIESADGRIQLLENYLSKYNSKLLPYSKYIVDLSDKYYLDYRLIVAIAQQESNLCKIIPDDSFNCWGWGIHSRGTLRFTSYEEAIETVIKGIKKDYIDKGYNTVEQIMSKYTPQSPGTWANGVNQFMQEIENPGVI